jgi:hypothetical protein
MSDTGFYQVQFVDEYGRVCKLAVVTDSLTEANRMVVGMNINRPKLRPMTQAEVKKWRGATIYPK